MNFDDFTSMQIDGQEITELRIDGVLVWEKNTVSNDLVLSFTGNNFSVDSYSQGLTGRNIVIDWGDGTTTNYTGVSDLSHTYSVTGNYSITISGITSLENSCFYGCSGLTSVVIPEGVTSLVNGCFSYCSDLASVVIPEQVTSIGGGCFHYCSNLTSVVIPENVTSIGNSCFYYCSNLTSIVIPDNVTRLEDNCFYHCTGLTNVVISKNVTSLGGSCFRICSGLTNIEIPEGVTNIGADCFRGCSNLTSLICNWESNPPSYNSSWITSTSSSFKFSIPYGTTSVYTAAGYPSDKLVEREEEHGGVTPTVNNIVLTSDKSILSAYDGESATLTATITGTNVDGLEVEFFNGSTSMGTSIVTNGVATKSYTATGSGDVTITAECMNVQGTYSIEDIFYYDSLTTDKQRYTTVSGSPVLTYSSNGLNVNTSVAEIGLVKNNFLTLPSDYEAEITCTSQTSSGGCGICFDDWLLDSGAQSLCATYKLSTTTKLSNDLSKFNTNDVVKIVKKGTSIKYYLNNVLKVTNTISDDNHLQQFRTYQNRSTTFKDLKIKQIDNGNGMVLTSDKTILSAYDSDTCTLTAELTNTLSEKMSGKSVNFIEKPTNFYTNDGTDTSTLTIPSGASVTVEDEALKITTSTTSEKDIFYNCNLNNSDNFIFEYEVAKLGTTQSVAIILGSSTNWFAYQNSTNKWDGKIIDSFSNIDTGTLAVGDKIKIKQENGVITLYHNDAVIYSKSANLGSNYKIGHFTNSGRVQYIKNIKITDLAEDTLIGTSTLNNQGIATTTLTSTGKGMRQITAQVDNIESEPYELIDAKYYASNETINLAPRYNNDRNLFASDYQIQLGDKIHFRFKNITNHMLWGIGSTAGSDICFEQVGTTLKMWRNVLNNGSYNSPSYLPTTENDYIFEYLKYDSTQWKVNIYIGDRYVDYWRCGSSIRKIRIDKYDNSDPSWDVEVFVL